MTKTIGSDAPPAAQRSHEHKTVTLTPVASATAPVPALAPFSVRNFRFQWPGDLATSWAFEMETVILGWYVLVETGSVLLLTLFGSLQYLGTLIAPMFGVLGDRIGHRNLLCIMRGIYAALATTLMALAYTDVLTPVYVFVIATLMGIVRPSDLVMRWALIGETMPPRFLMAGMSVARTTMDSARVVGALAGAGLVAAFGMGPAYTAIAGFYAASLLLTLRITDASPASHVSAGRTSARASPWRDLSESIGYVWTTPQLLALMCLAFLLNLTAFPLVGGLLPYVAKEIYHTDQTGLGYMVASVASGALAGSIGLSRYGSGFRPARMMVVFCGVWYAVGLVFAHMDHAVAGMAVLFCAGVAQSLNQTPMAAVLLRNSDAQFRGRVVGLRMLAIYGLPLGLMISGPLIARYGYPMTATLYCLIGLAFTVLVAVRWRRDLWRHDAPANRR